MAPGRAARRVLIAETRCHDATVTGMSEAHVAFTIIPTVVDRLPGRTLIGACDGEEEILATAK